MYANHAYSKFENPYKTLPFLPLLNPCKFQSHPFILTLSPSINRFAIDRSVSLSFEIHTSTPFLV